MGVLAHGMGGRATFDTKRVPMYSVRLLLPLACSVPLAASAQLPMVDITLVDVGNNDMEVRIRPDGDFDEFFSSLSFTIRWETASGADLGNVVQTIPELIYMPVIKSGPQVDDNGYRYQVFFGLGSTPLNQVGVAWTAGTEVTIMTISAINGSGLFEIVNDAWTSDVNNNGDFYVSLNGQDRTGQIYAGSVSIAPGGATRMGTEVLPNPSEGLFWLHMDADATEPLLLSLFDQTGRCIWSDRQVVAMAGHREAIDLVAEPAGVYSLRVVAGDQVTTHRLVRR